MAFSPTENPYETDAPNAFTPNPETLRLARSLATWQFFIAFLLVLLTVLALAAIVIGLVFDGESLTAVVGPTICVGFMMLLFYILPAFFLFRAGQEAKAFGLQRAMHGIHEFSSAQATFWRIVGIMVIVGFVLWFGMMLLAIVGVGFGAIAG